MSSFGSNQSSMCVSYLFQYTPFITNNSHINTIESLLSDSTEYTHTDHSRMYTGTHPANSLPRSPQNTLILQTQIQSVSAAVEAAIG